MSGSRSVSKAARVQERRRQHNRYLRGRTRTILKQAKKSMASGDPEQSQAATIRAVSTLDRAATKGLFHKNKTARLKSRLMKRANVIGVSRSE